MYVILGKPVRGATAEIDHEMVLAVVLVLALVVVVRRGMGDRVEVVAVVGVVGMVGLPLVVGVVVESTSGPYHMSPQLSVFTSLIPNFAKSSTIVNQPVCPDGKQEE